MILAATEHMAMLLRVLKRTPRGKSLYDFRCTINYEVHLTDLAVKLLEVRKQTFSRKVNVLMITVGETFLCEVSVN